ncbi:MAG: helix-turn-helix transcriptional regulator [Fluviicola sp.]|nr:helix-turn-helix transcriptional regulator [Fluviicola sp.]
MEYHEYPPSAALAPFVKCFWSLESDDETHERDRIFPDGNIELILHYRDLFKKYDDAGNAVVQPRSFFHGQLKRYFELQPTGKVGVFSARFHPAGLRPFVPFSVSKITDLTAPTTQAWGEKAIQLERDLLKADTTEQRISIMETFLLGQLNQEQVDAIVENCVGSIIEQSGITSVDELTQQQAIGKRALERRFQQSVGLSPKLFARIIRFNYALQLIEKRDFSNFTVIAYEGGFYDQAHFIKDFHDLTGLNPKQYFSKNLEMVRFFNLD